MSLEEDWSAWVECPVTCGGGSQTRTRDVAVPPTNGGKACVGQRGCSMNLCALIFNNCACSHSVLHPC